MPTRAEPRELAEREVAEAVTVVETVAKKYDLVVDPEGPEIMRLSQEEDEWDDRIVAVYLTGSDAATDHRVVVTVMTHKKSRRFRVLARDLDSLVSTDFTA